MTQKEEIVSTLEELVIGIKSNKIEFLGFIRDKKPKYNPKGIILKAKESKIRTVTFQYKKAEAEKLIE